MSGAKAYGYGGLAREDAGEGVGVDGDDSDMVVYSSY